MFVTVAFFRSGCALLPRPPQPLAAFVLPANGQRNQAHLTIARQ